jgi:flavin reductase (DIM6/NTAB) family NADH-FMN oxidoreductase RutF
MPGSSEIRTRRVFLKGTAAAAALAAFGSPGCAGEQSGLLPGQARRELPEPGPMLPPVPAILLTVNGAVGGPDEISVVWTFVVNGDPPQIGISVGDEHVAGGFVRQHGEFVLNVPTVGVVEAFDVVDMNSGKIEDKYALSGLTRGNGLKVDAPTVEESPIHVECRVFDEIRVPPVRTIFLAAVVATTVHEGACDENGRLIVPAVPFFGMTAGSGEFYTMGKAVGHIGQSVGRDDIKY